MAIKVFLKNPELVICLSFPMDAHFHGAQRTTLSFQHQVSLRHRGSAP